MTMTTSGLKGLREVNSSFLGVIKICMRTKYDAAAVNISVIC